jgi:sporulation protein YlmC with PRC-barrel domain
MPETLLFRLGAHVRCTDGDGGQLRTLVINPADDRVTHLVVEPTHRHGLGKLVPFRLVDATVADPASGDVRLSCSTAEFGQLDPAEATYFFPGDEDYETYRWEPVVSWPYFAPQDAMLGGAPGAPGGYPGEVAQVVTVDTVSDQLPGEDEVSRGERVHAKDGDIGRLQGIVVDLATGRVTSLLLKEGHLLNRRTVLIPRSAVAEVGADGFHLHTTTQQVRDLPPADLDHSAG